MPLACDCSCSAACEIDPGSEQYVCVLSGTIQPACDAWHLMLQTARGLHVATDPQHSKGSNKQRPHNMRSMQMAALHKEAGGSP